jgi:hypothetical protein
MESRVSVVWRAESRQQHLVEATGFSDINSHLCGNSGGAARCWCLHHTYYSIGVGHLHFCCYVAIMVSNGF